MRRMLSASLLLFVAACGATDDATDEVAVVADTVGLAAVDHVIVSIDSLERGMMILEEMTGVAPTIGGVHPGRGTRNALMSLGPSAYLELLAPNPTDSAGPRVREEMARFTTLTPTGWAAMAGDATALHGRLTADSVLLSELRPGMRATPTGDTLRWITFAPPALAGEWMLPLYIQWVAPTPHPATTTPTGCTLVGLSFHTPAPDSLRTMLRSLRLGVAVDSAAERTMRIRMACPKGIVELPTGAG